LVLSISLTVSKVVIVGRVTFSTVVLSHIGIVRTTCILNHVAIVDHVLRVISTAADRLIFISLVIVDNPGM
jgi:hypothetical protein